MTCVICCESFTKCMRSKFICRRNACLFECCRKCIKNYIESTLTVPHCMSCKYEYDDVVIMNEITQTYFNNVYQAKMTDIVMHLERSLITSTLDEAVQYKRKRDATLLMSQLIIEKNNLIAEIIYCEKRPYEPYITQLHALNTKLSENMNKSSKPLSEIHADKKQKIIMRCQHDQCKGSIVSSYVCNLCNRSTCSKCLCAKIDNTHTCDTDNILSASFIKKDTKPCPNCSQRIHKVEGCDQMWCTECNTAFSWSTGVLVIGTVHNPHYFDWMNQTGNIPIEECGQMPYFRFCYVRCRYEPQLDQVLRSLSEIIRFTAELHANELPFTPQTYKSIRIEYILNMITESEWRSKINKQRLKIRNAQQHRQFMDVLHKVSIDILHKYVKLLKDEPDIIKIGDLLENLIQEHTVIIKYINQQKIERAFIYKKGVKLVCMNKIGRIIILYKSYKRILSEESKIDAS